MEGQKQEQKQRLTRYLTVEEAAQMYHVSNETVRRWCRTGVLQAKRIAKRWLIPIEQDEQE